MLADILSAVHMQLNQPRISDVMLVLGSHDIRVAQKAADLYLKGFAPIIVFSGGQGRLTEGLWSTSEAEQFALEAMKLGVPEANILKEVDQQIPARTSNFTAAIA